MKKLLLAGGVAALALVFAIMVLPATLFAGMGSTPIQNSTSCGSGQNSQNFAAPASVTVNAASLSSSQIHFAELVIGVAKNRGLGPRDAAIGVMVAAQESSLSNETTPNGINADSVGLFQQRPSMGWGSGQNLSDPVYATNKFFNVLSTIKNRDQMPMWQAGQAVQHSSDGSLYAKWQDMATQVANQGYKASGPTQIALPGGQSRVNQAPVDTAALTGCAQVTSGVTSAAASKVVHSALTQLGLPYLWGGNIPKGQPGAGLDCSGLTQWSYKQAGIAIPRVANDQYNAAKVKFAAPADPAKLQPGDLLFENWNEQGQGSGWGHVGMYIGGGKVVEEPSTGFVAKVLPYSSFAPKAVGRYIIAKPKPIIAAPPAGNQPAGSGVLAGKVIVIDPGHNGGNGAAASVINRSIWNGRANESCDTTGAETNGGYTEAKFNWNVANKLAADLRAQGATVILTRDSNSGVGPCVTQRTAIGNKAHADAAISIHADGGPANGSGFAVLTPVADGPNNQIIGASDSLGNHLRDAFLAGTGEHVSSYDGVNGIQPRNDLAGTNLSKVPKVFLECANMRNASDASLVTSPTWQATAAQAIAAGLTAYLTGK